VVLIAEEGGTVVGFAQLEPESGQVEAVYVSPRHAGQGVDGRLLRALEAEAWAAGLRRVSVAATLDMVPFYANAGYRATGKGKHRLPN
jgi:N-acetylglutamate synthase-like GNAT family acetyltransferase